MGDIIRDKKMKLESIDWSGHDKHLNYHFELIAIMLLITLLLVPPHPHIDNFKWDLGHYDHLTQLNHHLELVKNDKVTVYPLFNINYFRILHSRLTISRGII